MGDVGQLGWTLTAGRPAELGRYSTNLEMGATKILHFVQNDMAEDLWAVKSTTTQS